MHDENLEAMYPLIDNFWIFAMLSIQTVFFPQIFAANKNINPGAAPVLITTSGDSFMINFIAEKKTGNNK